VLSAPQPRLVTTHRPEKRHDQIIISKTAERHFVWPVHSLTENKIEMPNANFSRRAAILAGATSVPAQALPAVAVASTLAAQS
jgi:hypothetical protein